MTKYKLNNTDVQNSTITLTSFVPGKEHNLNSESNCNMAEKSCQLCLPSVGSLESVDKTAASVFRLQGVVCPCQKCEGDCKRCPRANSSQTLTLTLDSDGCPSCLSTQNHSYLEAASDDPSAKAGKGLRALGRALSCCSLKGLKRRMPILVWLPNYTAKKAFSDALAGLTVALTIIPQGIAYARVAGLPPEYGLYSSLMSSFAYSIFGSVKYSSIGPTAIEAILTRDNIHGLGPQFASLLAFLSGCVELLMGIFQLGFLMDLFSLPVSVGFTSAAAIIIATSQVKDILGLDFPGGRFLQVWAGVYEHISETHLWDAALGATCFVALLLLKRLQHVKAPADSSRPLQLLVRALHLLSILRNILALTASTGLAYFFQARAQRPFTLTGEVSRGLPPLAWPPLSATAGNHTYAFAEMAATLGSSVLVVPLLSILETVAVAKHFCAEQEADASQEMVALGVCNVLGSCAGAFPVAGALSRGAVARAARVAEPGAALFTGAVVALSLQFASAWFALVPRAALGGAVAAAVVPLAGAGWLPLGRSARRREMLTAVVTAAVSLGARLELGAAAGVALALALQLSAGAGPSLSVVSLTDAEGSKGAVLRVAGALWFASGRSVREALRQAERRAPATLVLDGRSAHSFDATIAAVLAAAVRRFLARGTRVLALGPPESPLARLSARCGVPLAPSPDGEPRPLRPPARPAPPLRPPFDLPELGSPPAATAPSRTRL